MHSVTDWDFYEKWNNAGPESLLWALMCKWLWHFWCLRWENVQFKGALPHGAWNWNSSRLALPPASRFVWFLSSLSYNLESTRYRMDSAPIVSLFQCLWEPLCMYPPLIQPFAFLSPHRLNVSSLTLKSSHNLFCLYGLPPAVYVMLANQ